MATAGVNRADTYLAWYFTVASARSLAGRVLSMRDDAFGKLNGQAPEFEVTGTDTEDLAARHRQDRDRAPTRCRCTSTRAASPALA